MKVLCFRLDFKHSIGGGHFQRCLNIMNSIKIKKKVIFIIQSDISSRAKIKKLISDKKIYFLTDFNIRKEIRLFNNINLKYNDITYVFDVCNNEKIKNKKKLLLYFEKLKHLHKKFFIDGAGNERFLPLISKLNFKGIITPYFEKKKKLKTTTQYSGIKYFIFNPKMIVKNTNFTQINNILVTFGNSDPKSITTFILKNLILLKKKIFIKVVIGPLFKFKLINELIKIKKNEKKHKIIFLYNKKNLSNEFNWCNFAIISCGLTKYEAILYKKPSLVVPYSLDSENLTKKIINKKLFLMTQNINKLMHQDFLNFLILIFQNKLLLKTIVENCKKLKLNNNNLNFTKTINFNEKK